MQGNQITIFKKSKKVIPVIGFSLIVILVFQNLDYHKILLNLKKADLRTLSLVTALASSQILFSCFRFYYFLRASNEDIAISRCLNAVMTAFSLNSIIPGKGGELVKAMFLTNEKEKLIRFTAVTFIERLTDLCVLSVILFIGACLTQNFYWQLLSVGALVFFGGLILSMDYAKKVPLIGSKLSSLENLIPALRTNTKYLLAGIGSSFTIWFINIIIINLLLASTLCEVSIIDTFANWPKAILAGIIPVSLSGFGTRDASFAYFLGESLTNTRIFAATFLYTLFMYWYLSLLSFSILAIKGVFNLRTK